MSYQQGTIPRFNDLTKLIFMQISALHVRYLSEFACYCNAGISNGPKKNSVGFVLRFLINTIIRASNHLFSKMALRALYVVIFSLFLDSS